MGPSLSSRSELRRVNGAPLNVTFEMEVDLLVIKEKKHLVSSYNKKQFAATFDDPNIDLVILFPNP